MSGACVPQGMRPAVRELDPKCVDPLPYSVIELSGRDGPPGRLECKEYFAVCAFGTDLAYITDDRVADLASQRKLLGSTRLCPSHCQSLVLPVDVIQTQLAHLAAAQTVDSKKQQGC